MDFTATGELAPNLLTRNDLKYYGKILDRIDGGRYSDRDVERVLDLGFTSARNGSGVPIWLRWPKPLRGLFNVERDGPCCAAALQAYDAWEPLARLFIESPDRLEYVTAGPDRDDEETIRRWAGDCAALIRVAEGT